MSTFSIAIVLASFLALTNAGDMMRKSIVFDKNTPDVFYCPQRKPTGFDKMIVHSRPLSRLCQFEGGPIPEDYKSDCYNDIDESEYACREKYRIMFDEVYPAPCKTRQKSIANSRVVSWHYKLEKRRKPEMVTEMINPLLREAHLTIWCWLFYYRNGSKTRKRKVKKTTPAPVTPR